MEINSIADVITAMTVVSLPIIIAYLSNRDPGLRGKQAPGLFVYIEISYNMNNPKVNYLSN